MTTYPVAVLRDTKYTAVLLNSKNVAVPMTHVAPVGPKGDPGGNIMAIGLFEDAPALTISNGTNVVRTAGYSADGRGIADYFYDAAVDAAYVTAHPRTAFVSTNSRGFRLDASAGLNILQVGGVADCSTVGSGTDNAPALNAAKAALGNGGSLHIPQGPLAYRVASAISFTEGIRIHGDGWHQNSGTVGGTTYTGIQRYPGTVLCFDANVAGFQFLSYTDNLANAVAYEFQSSNYSSIENIMLFGGGGTSTSAHGLETRICLFATNVRMDYFAGNGVYINAYTSGAQPYGSADLSVLRSVHSNYSGCHGFLIRGNDANVVTFLGCSSTNNGGVGFFDTGFLGNNYQTCHAANNNTSYGTSGAQRTYVTDGSGGVDVQIGWTGLSDHSAGSFVTTRVVGRHTFIGCYVEDGWGSTHEIIWPSIIIGGALASIAHTGNPDASSKPPTFENSMIRNIDSFAARTGAGFDFDNIIRINGAQVIGPKLAAIAYPTGGTTQDTEARYVINVIISRLFTHGLIAG